MCLPLGICEALAIGRRTLVETQITLSATNARYWRSSAGSQTQQSKWQSGRTHVIGHLAGTSWVEPAPEQLTDFVRLGAELICQALRTASWRSTVARVGPMRMRPLSWILSKRRTRSRRWSCRCCSPTAIVQALRTRLSLRSVGRTMSLGTEQRENPSDKAEACCRFRRTLVRWNVREYG